MTGASPQSGNAIACPYCGFVQERSSKKCSRCGRPISSPSQIYRREPDGTWSPIQDIDLSSLAPKPLSPRRRWNFRKLAAILVLLVLPGAALDFWLWRMRVRAAREEAAEVATYANNPVGKIIPHFEARYTRTPSSELQIAGQTNLPDGTVLEIRVYSGDVLVAVDFPVTVQGGAFQTRPVLQRGKPFTPASYQLRIEAGFGTRWQAPGVLQIVGPRGQRLDGPLIHRTVGASDTRLEFIQDFVLTP